jgi:hypothetical protein
LISRHTGTQRGGVITWVKGAWKAKGDTQELKNVEACIDRAVSDLTLSEVWRGFTQQERSFAQQVHATLSAFHIPTMPRPHSLYTFQERSGLITRLAWEWLCTYAWPLNLINACLIFQAAGRVPRPETRNPKPENRKPKTKARKPKTKAEARNQGAHNAEMMKMQHDQTRC